MTDAENLQELNAQQNRQNSSMELKQPKRKSRVWPFLIGLVLGMAVMAVFSTVYISICGVGILGQSDQDSSEGSALNADSAYKIQKLESAIDQFYYKADEVTRQQKEEGLYKGLLESLGDPYSVYYTKEEAEELNQSISGTFYGIGAYLSLDPDTEVAKISGVKKGSPAEAAGLMTNDLILNVDGESTQGMTLDEVVSHVRGEDGTKVVLTIYRDQKTQDVEITRAEVSDTTVYSEVLDDTDGIGYLEITEFDLVTTDQFKEEINNLLDQNIKGLILDLRDNPGGSVDTVTEIADWFLPEGIVFYMEDAQGKRTNYTCKGENQLDIPVAVLVNENSASASEILSGAIKDAGTGTLVGKKTYGKGVVQSVFSLDDDSALKITIADYYTRNGNNINKQGIEPDVDVELDVDKYLEDGTDDQKNAAIEVLKKQMK